MRYYYDKRTDEIVSEKEIDIAWMAPETYFEIIESASKDIYTEVWLLGSGKCIDVNYSQYDRDMETDTSIRSIRLSGIPDDVLYITKWYIPSNTFKTIIENFGYKYNNQ